MASRWTAAHLIADLVQVSATRVAKRVADVAASVRAGAGAGGGLPPHGDGLRLGFEAAQVAPGAFGAGASQWSAAAALERAGEVLREHVWLAVPKKKKSYSRTRQRFNNPAKQLKNIAHFYPCMRCDRGLLKLRHHLCPCDLEKVKAKNVVRVAYGEGPLAGDPQPGRRRGGAEAAEGGAEDDA